MQLNSSAYKSSFLSKKHEEKKKIKDHAKMIKSATLIATCTKSFLARCTLLHRQQQLQSYGLSYIRTLLLLKHSLEHINSKQLQYFIKYLRNSEMNEKSQQFYIKRLVVGAMKIQQLLGMALQVVLSSSESFKQILIADTKFSIILIQIIEYSKYTVEAIAFIQFAILEFYKCNRLKQVPPNCLFNLLLRPYPSDLNQMCIEYAQLKDKTIIKVLSFLYDYSPEVSEQIIKNDGVVGLYKRVIQGVQKKMQDVNLRALICMNRLMRKLIKYHHGQVVRRLQCKNKHLINLIADNEDMRYFQERLKRQQQYVQFQTKYINHVQSIFRMPALVAIFNQGGVGRYLEYIDEIKDLILYLTRIFPVERLDFIRQMVSSKRVLNSFYEQLQPLQQNSFRVGNSIFFEALRMNIGSMEDIQFYNCDIFTRQRWCRLIKFMLRYCYKILISQSSKKEERKLKLFQFDDDPGSNQLEILRQFMDNFYKKCLRTKYLKSQLNIEFNQMSYQLSENKLSALKMMLHDFPYVFTFESRVQRLRQLIKKDKEGYDRTLFSQQDPDDQLIIEIRRGHEFMDAYNVCLNRDLHKKYKIIFYNQQGLEEEGIDGGGILKEFINRVLKISFSQIYSLFQSTQNNQIIPNSYSKCTQEYQFIGRIIGKAVYENITIEQKFASPFLNLILNRKNGFDQMRYIDQQIYESLLKIKKMSAQQLKQMYQTFIIHDHQVNGEVHYINLLSLDNPKQSYNKDVMLTISQFIYNYVNYKCNVQLEDKARLFRRGFLSMIKEEWLNMFNNEQLNLLISGLNQWTIDQFKHAIIYSNGYHDKHVLQEYNSHQKELFLLFITSVSRPPILGFESIKPKICIMKVNDQSYLPTANTCMNVLRLPNYSSKKKLHEKLSYAIHAKAGFEII